MFSEQFAGELLDDFGEWGACERSIGDEAGAVGVIGDFPAFGVIGFGADLSSEEGMEFAATPTDAFENWGEGKRRQRIVVWHLRAGLDYFILGGWKVRGSSCGRSLDLIFSDLGRG